LVEKKGMDLLILAAQELRKREIDFIIELGGSGELKNDLRELVNQYSLESHIVFAGAISHHQVSAWLQKADIFVLACKQDRHGDQDGIPVVLMEAMAMGIPVVSTAISGIPELIQDGVSGFLATPNDPMSLTDKICQALNPKNDILKITHLARATIVKSFDIKSTGQLSFASTSNYILGCHFKLLESIKTITSLGGCSTTYGNRMHHCNMKFGIFKVSITLK
jgi:glycosyltransferase involved in cell wall biosynthesis